MRDRLPADDPLARLIEDWVDATPAPSAGLEERILAALRAEREAEARPQPSATPTMAGTAPPWYHPAAWGPSAWAAAGACAALLVVGLVVLARPADPAAPTRAERLLVADALRDAEAAERQHARAIAELQRLATPVLARAHDSDLDGRHAARLLVLGNRLRFLDQTIAEIREYLDDNPGHPGARTTLLAAFTEKTDVLRDVLALHQEIDS